MQRLLQQQWMKPFDDSLRDWQKPAEMFDRSLHHTLTPLTIGDGNVSNVTMFTIITTTKTTTTTAVDDDDDYHSRSIVFFFTIAAVVMMWPVAVSLNCLVCVVIYRSRRLQSTTNYFVLSLAFADLCLAFVVIPFVFSRIIINRWPPGNIYTCKLVRFAQNQFISASANVLVSICADRYYTIIYPLSFRVTRTRAKYMCFGSWFIAALIAAPGLYFYDIIHERGKPFCNTSLHGSWPGVIYSMLLTNFSLVIPVIALSIGYVKIFRFIWALKVRGFAFQRTAHLVPRRKVKTVKMIIIVTIVNMMLAVPIIISQLRCCATSGYHTFMSRNVFTYSLLVYFTTTVCKPGLYLCYNSNFRRGCKEVFCMSAMKCYRHNAYTITGSSQLAKRNHVGISDLCTQPARIDTPSKTFNRTSRLEANKWPIHQSNSSTSV